MRWLLLLLVVLNIFYYVWHQQEAPRKVKEIVSLSLYKGSQQDIRLLGESSLPMLAPQDIGQQENQAGCFYLDKSEGEELLSSLSTRLITLGVDGKPYLSLRDGSQVYAFRIDANRRSKITEEILQSLFSQIKGLKYEKYGCLGLQ